MAELFDIKMGEKLHSLRTKKKLSQQDVADRMDKARSTISAWEKGTRTIMMTDFLKFCDICGVDGYDELNDLRKYVYKK